jgi:hypothetical protein
LLIPDLNILFNSYFRSETGSTLDVILCLWYFCKIVIFHTLSNSQEWCTYTRKSLVQLKNERTRRVLTGAWRPGGLEIFRFNEGESASSLHPSTLQVYITSSSALENTCNCHLSSFAPRKISHWMNTSCPISLFRKFKKQQNVYTYIYIDLVLAMLKFLCKINVYVCL